MHDYFQNLFVTQQHSIEEDTNTDNIKEDEDIDTPFTLLEIKTHYVTK